MRRCLVTTLVLLASCRRTDLPATPDLLTSDSIDFPRTFVNHPTEVVLRSTTAGTHPSLVVTEPFELVAAPLTPGPLKLRFAPKKPGRYVRVLRVLRAGGEHDVRLTAFAEPDCERAGLCDRSRFRPELNRCEPEVEPEGGPCDDKCLVGAHCERGACVGEKRDCDDGIACTADSCEPTRGCDHLGRSDRCPESPCTYAQCVPSAGCVAAPSPDRTPCRDGALVHGVCVAGRCTDLAAGLTAAPLPSPAAVLEPVWRYATADALDFDGVFDDGGDSFFVECVEGAGCVLVSLDRDGATRFRSALALPQGEAQSVVVDSSMALVRDLVVVSTSRYIGADRSSVVQAFRAADGTPVWSRQLAAADVGQTGNARLSVRALTLSRSDELALGVAYRDGTGTDVSALLTLQTSTGAPITVMTQPSLLRSLWMSDGLGRLFYRHEPESAAATLVAYDPQVGEAWSVDEPRLPRAVVSGSLVLDDLSLLRIADGTTTRTTVAACFHDVVSDGTTAWAISKPPGQGRMLVRSWPAAMPEQVRGSAVEFWSVTSMALATSRGTLLVANPDAPDGGILEFDANGAPLRTLALSSALSFSRGLGLHRGRLIVGVPGGVVAYDLPDAVDVAEHGWVAERGNLQRTGAPR